MKILTVLGARPQFIKAAAVSRAITKHRAADNKEIEEIIVHTGQHYDANMSDIFFDELEIPKPNYRLECGGVGHGCMTGQMLERIEKIILTEKPNWVLVYGDTNSTLAGALAASKMHIPVAHVEAGLRSYNMAMPEEINRVLTDRVSNYLFCPTDTAVQNLKKEGFPHPTTTKEVQKIFQIGDVMYDATLFYRERAKKQVSLNRWNLEDKEFALCTIHRAENTDEPSRLKSIFQALHQINKKVPVILPMHPRTKKIIEKSSFSNLLTNLKIVEPLSYLETQRLEMDAKAILTDSGGMQKEAYFHKIPCITFRDETEWVETVNSGWNTLVGASTEKILKAVDESTIPTEQILCYGDGHSACKMIQWLA
jgi:UDP-GlcNAc3NAcA epimerase